MGYLSRLIQFSRADEAVCIVMILWLHPDIKFEYGSETLKAGEFHLVPDIYGCTTTVHGLSYNLSKAILSRNIIGEKPTTTALAGLR